MATTAPSKTEKAQKEVKPPVAVSVRIIDQMKRGALQGKLTADELDSLANLAQALKTFVTA